MKKCLHLFFLILSSISLIAPSVFAGRHGHSSCCMVHAPIQRFQVRQPAAIIQPMPVAMPTDPQIQAICAQLRHIIENPSVDGYRNGINLLAALRVLDQAAFSHFYRIFDRTLGHMRNMRQPAANPPVVNRPVINQQAPRAVNHPGPSRPRPAPRHRAPVPVHHAAPQPAQHRAVPAHNAHQPAQHPAAPARHETRPVEHRAEPSPEPARPPVHNPPAQRPPIDSEPNPFFLPEAPDQSAPIANDNDEMRTTIYNQQEEIRQLREYNTQLTQDLETLQRQQRAVPQQVQRNREDQTRLETQQQRIAQLEAHVHQLDEQAGDEHHLLQLMEQFGVQMMGGAQTNPPLNEGQMIDEYNRALFHRFHFDIRPALEQINSHDLQGAAATINNHSQDPTFLHFAFNHPLIQLARNGLLAEQITQEQTNMQEADPDEQNPAAQIQPSAPAFTPDVFEEDQFPPLLQNIPAARPPFHPDHIAIPVADHATETPPAEQQQPSWFGSAWNYMKGLPAATASGAARVLRGVFNW